MVTTPFAVPYPVLKRIGGSDPSFGTCPGCDDTHLGARLIAAGCYIAPLRQARAWHLSPASTNPHWDSDNPEWALRAFPDDWKQKIFWDNAAKLYKLDERLEAAAA